MATDETAPVGMVLCSATLPTATALTDRIAAASAAGFSSLSLWGRDYELARASGHSDDDLRRGFSAGGITVAELDGVWGWTPGALKLGMGVDPYLDHDEVSLYAIADVLGGRSINAVDVFGGGWSLDDAVEAFASLCDRAAEHGLLVHLEALPWSRIPTVTDAMAIVDRAGRANGGLMIDAWHLFRGFTNSSDALAAVRALDGSRVFAVQLGDGPVEVEPDLATAALHHRLLPGEGSFDLAGLVGALDSIGSTAQFGIEVFSDAWQHLDPFTVASRAFDASRKILQTARAQPDTGSVETS